MIPFVNVQNLASWASSAGVEEVLTGMVDYLEADFERWPVFDKTPRTASHSSDGVIELMPTSDDKLYSFKYVNGHPINTKRGMQTITAFGVLASVETGYPIFVSEMTVLTAFRTAATSAMAAKLLAPKAAETMAMIGTGAQAEFQALAFRTVLGIDSLRIWDTDPAALEKFVANVEPLGFSITVASNAAEAVAGADIITTCTADKAYATILSNDMVDQAVHINAIGGDCPGKTELEASLLQRSDVFVEYTEQTRIEGEIQQFDDDFEVTELWEVLTGRKDGRTTDQQITVFDSVGFAIEDFSALRYLYDGIQGTSFYDHIDLIAEPEDPKNVFSLLELTAQVD